MEIALHFPAKLPDGNVTCLARNWDGLAVEANSKEVAVPRGLRCRETCSAYQTSSSLDGVSKGQKSVDPRHRVVCRGDPSIGGTGDISERSSLALPANETDRPSGLTDGEIMLTGPRKMRVEIRWL